MNGKTRITILLAALALLGCSAGFVLDSLWKERVRLDVSRGAVTTLTAGSYEALADLREPVKITYYVTERRRMPTALRNVEGDIRALLREMRRHAGTGFAFEVIHPEDSPQIARTLGRFRITSFQHKTIRRDEYNVDTVWSGMLIEYKGQSRAIPYITREHFPFLQEQIITHIRNIATGYRPFIAVQAPGDYQGLRSMITGVNGEEVKGFHFAKGAGIPGDADMAFIMQPENLSRHDVDSIASFLRDGKDVVVSFSLYDAEPHPGDKMRVIPRKTGLEEYLAGLGVTLERRMLLERRNRNDMPFLGRIQGASVNLDGFRLQRCGELFVPYASPISVDVPKLRSGGYHSDTLMFSSNEAWTLPYGENGSLFTREEIVTPRVSPQAKNIGVVLTSERPWEGRLFLYSSGHLFSDHAGGANQLYLKNFLMTFAEADKLVSLKSGGRTPPSIAPRGAAARVLWRAFAIGAVPAVLLLLLFVNILSFPVVDTARRRFDLRLLSILAGGGAAVFLIIFICNRLVFVSFDATWNGANSSSPLAVEKVRELGDGVSALYFASPASEMPLDARSMVKETADKLAAMARVSRGSMSFELKTVAPGELREDALKQSLERYGIRPFKMRMVEHDRYVEKMAYSGLVFAHGERFEVIPQLTSRNASRVEFLAVSAFKRLKEGKRPSIAFVADLPHLTPAEFWELQQQEVQTMPKSEDVYARLIGMLRNEGYAVNVFNSKKDDRIDGDVLIYLQPWVVSGHMKREVNRFLSAGRSVLLAAQHYRMQSRKYPGRGYSAVYWPQPQFSRVNELLADYGVELVQEVFLDQSKAPIETREQIRWGAYKKQDKRAPDAQPFIIRAVPAHFDTASPVTARLSDVLFIWGNRFRKLPERFPSGLRLRTLIASSIDSWSLDWKGGFLREEDLRQGSYFDAAQPLCVLLEGVFPRLDGVTSGAGREGKLLLVGSSKMLDNEQLDTTRYDNEKFILNAVAELAYGSELAHVQSAGGQSAPGFAHIPPERKLLWRYLAAGLCPTFFALYGIFRLRRRTFKAASRTPAS